MTLAAHIEPLSGKLPTISWRWDPETDILSGAFKASRKVGGLTGTVELTDDASNKLLELRRKRSERAHKAQISRLGAHPGESDGAPPDKTHDGEPGSGH